MQSNPENRNSQAEALKPRCDGIEYDFGGGIKYVIPPITLGALQKMRRHLTVLQSITEADALAGADVCIEVAHVAMLRNYPTLTLEDVGNLIDLGNMHEIMSCVLDLDGSLRKARLGHGSPAQGGIHG